MLFAAVLIGVGFSRDVPACGALALLERIGIGGHDFGLLALFDPASFFAGAFESDALLRSASLRSIGMPCFLSTSANASSASSWIVAIRSRPSCFSLSKVSSSKAINLRTTEAASRSTRDMLIQWRGKEIVPSWNEQRVLSLESERKIPTTEIPMTRVTASIVAIALLI